MWYRLRRTGCNKHVISSLIIGVDKLWKWILHSARIKFSLRFFTHSQWFSNYKINNSDMRWALNLWQQMDNTSVVFISAVVNAKNAIHFWLKYSAKHQVWHILNHSVTTKCTPKAKILKIDGSFIDFGQIFQ